MSWNIDILWSLNFSDTFPRRKFENRPLKSCRPGPMLSISTISFELHTKVVEEIYLEMCIYGQLLEVQMVRDLALDHGSGQGHINIHSTCRTTSMPNHVTVASRSMEIRPFEFREISTNGEVWTLVIAFLGGNSKIGLRQAVVQVPYYDHRPSVLSSTQNRRRPRKVHFSQLRELRDLDLDLRSRRGHTGAHTWSRSTHTPNWVEIGKTFCGHTEVRTDGRTHLSSNLLGHRLVMT